MIGIFATIGLSILAVAWLDRRYYVDGKPAGVGLNTPAEADAFVAAIKKVDTWPTRVTPSDLDRPQQPQPTYYTPRHAANEVAPMHEGGAHLRWDTDEYRTLTASYPELVASGRGVR